MSIHPEPHPLAGETVKVKARSVDTNGEPVDFVIEDWQSRVFQDVSWMDAEGNPAALMYAMRTVHLQLPMDNRVVYGKNENLGYIVHVSEIVEIGLDA